MRHWLAILLLVLLPTQATWAAMARYCVHETAAAGHFGHHDHAAHGHDSAVADITAHITADITADDPADSTSPMPAHDCDHCHGSHAGLVGVGAALAGATPGEPPSRAGAPPRAGHPAAQPDRPQWAPLA